MCLRSFECLSFRRRQQRGTAGIAAAAPAAAAAAVAAVVVARGIGDAAVLVDAAFYKEPVPAAALLCPPRDAVAPCQLPSRALPRHVGRARRVGHGGDADLLVRMLQQGGDDQRIVQACAVVATAAAEGRQ